MASFLDPLLDSPPDRYVLVNDRTGAIVASRLETAFDSAARNKGLLGRDSMPHEAALFIAPATACTPFSCAFPSTSSLPGATGGW